MTKIKGMSESSSAMLAAEAGERAAKKCAEMEAGQAILTASVKRSSKEKRELEKAQEEKSEEREERDKNPRDTPELSKQSKWFGVEGRLLEQENIKWELSMEEEIWKAFLNWVPREGEDLSAQLDELSRLYLALLEAVLTHTMGEEQAAWKDQLDAMLLEKLNLILDTDLEELVTFFKEAGQPEAVNVIKASMYRQTAGEHVSPKAAGEFFDRGSRSASTNSRFFMPETAGGTRETGVLYKRAGGGHVQVSQEFDQELSFYKGSSELQMSRRNMVLLSASGAGGSVPARSTSYIDGKELEEAERFVSHVNGRGNLLKDSEISAENEEVRGFLAAVTAIKGQVYMETAGREIAVKTPLRSALNQFIDYYLTQKGMYKAYYYTTNAYERTRSVQKTMEEGLVYAYKQFLEKKNQEAYRGQTPYSERAGFFYAAGKNLTAEEDLRRGLMFLEKNWREFLKSIGKEEQEELLVKLQKYSRWGELLRQEDRGKNKNEKPREAKRERIAMAQIICLGALGAVYVLYRLFFG